MWESYDYSAVEWFCDRDVRGHSRSQDLVYDDVVTACAQFREDTPTLSEFWLLSDTQFDYIATS